MTRTTDPSNNVSKIPQKFHDKAVQSNILWLNFKKIGEISTLQSAHKQGNLISLSCAGLKTQIPMHSNSLGCPKIFPLSASVLYWLSHLTGISRLKPKNERKTLKNYVYIAKDIQIQPKLFRYFLTNS